MEFDVMLRDAKSHIVIERNSVYKLKKWVEFPSKVMLITDEGVPSSLVECVASQIEGAYLLVLPQGETTKSFEIYQQVIDELLDQRFSRSDMIVALGGGVITDLCGFVAATYKRGCRLISIPTTTLAQIDASVGGKVAINRNGIKNCIGCFYHPETVIIDVTTLVTLPRRHFYNGLVEALKVGMIKDVSLYQIFKEEPLDSDIETIVQKAIVAKKEIVEMDEKDQNVRKLLNYGHTFGHAIESYYHLLHGESVANGMLLVLKDGHLKKEVERILQTMKIPLLQHLDKECLHFINQDKKIAQQHISLVMVDEVGKAYIENVNVEELTRELWVR